MSWTITEGSGWACLRRRCAAHIAGSEVLLQGGRVSWWRGSTPTRPPSVVFRGVGAVLACWAGWVYDRDFDRPEPRVAHTANNVAQCKVRVAHTAKNAVQCEFRVAAVRSTCCGKTMLRSRNATAQQRSTHRRSWSTVFCHLKLLMVVEYLATRCLLSLSGDEFGRSRRLKRKKRNTRTFWHLFQFSGYHRARFLLAAFLGVFCRARFLCREDVVVRMACTSTPPKPAVSLTLA